VATLTYVYADSTAVVGPLATYAEPHTYDLCEEHAVRLTAPRGWAVVRQEGDLVGPVPRVDDLEALADAVREAARPPRPPPGPDGGAPAGASEAPGDPTGPPPGGAGRRPHLRVLPRPS